jgi:CheY-like chemotaxis protein/KaiC/GvpD/RAD55 family RecA-like ATPase
LPTVGQQPHEVLGESVRRTGVPVIDSVIGGVGPGLPLVLAGPPGCGRTVLALELVSAALAERDIVALLSSEPAPLLLQQAASLGHPLTQAVVDEQLILLELDPIAPTNLAAVGGRALIEAVAEEHPTISMIVIDPFTMLTSEFMDEAPLRVIARELIAATPRTSLVLCVETDRPELEAPVERVLSEVCGSYVVIERDEDGTRSLRVAKTRAGVGRAEAVEFRIGATGVELARILPRAKPAPTVPADPATREATPLPLAPVVPEPAPQQPIAPAEPPVSAEAPAPAAPEPRPVPAAPAPLVPAAPVEPRRSHILVVDDDAEVRGDFCAWLGDRYELGQAADGFQAMTMALSQRPDLIVLDLEMPRVSGYEVLHALSGMEVGVPALAVLPCAPTRAGDRLAPMVLGATEIIHKPVDRFDLVNKCELLLRLEAPPQRNLDPNEAKALFDFAAHTRVVSAERFRGSLVRAHEIGSRFDITSTVLAIQAPSAPVLDEVRGAADEMLRFEDAAHVVSKRRLLMLLVAAEQANAEAVLERILAGTSLEGGAGRLRWCAHDARVAGATADWRHLFRSNPESDEDDEEDACEP